MPFSKNDPNINRKGRPKGSENVKAAMDEAGLDKEMLFEKLKKLVDSDYWPALKYACDHRLGMPIQRQEITGIDGEELYPRTINVVFGKDSGREDD